ncbi:MAG: hypothetical protein QXG39_09815 [Candidatus Aenigmatarchaeota archaeon]
MSEQKEETKPITVEEWLKHAENCPVCQKLLDEHGWIKKTNIDEIVKNKLREEWENRRKTKLRCANCDFPVLEQDPECPACGGKKARRI